MCIVCKALWMKVTRMMMMMMMNKRLLQNSQFAQNPAQLCCINGSFASYFRSKLLCNTRDVGYMQFQSKKHLALYLCCELGEIFLWD